MTPNHLDHGGRPAGAYLVHGEDPGLVSQALSALLQSLESLDDAGGIPIEEYGGLVRETRGRSDVDEGEGEDEGEGFALGPVLDACRTPPFLSERRIVVLRDTTVLSGAQVKEVTAYLSDPVETSVLVLVSPGKAAPAALVKAVSSGGVVIDTEPGSSAKARAAWISDHLRDAPVRPNADAVELLAEQLGEDLARLDGLMATLESAYGTDSVVGAREVAPFIGSAGAIPPWDLTDAINEGDVAKSLAALSRLLGPAKRHPFQVIAVLHRHYEAMLRLDGSGVTDQTQAAQLTGLSAFPARKALDAGRRLGHDRIARAVQLLADADFALRGETGWPDHVVMEVLVARLAVLGERRGAAPAGRRARRR